MNALLPQVESDGGKDIEVIGNTLSIELQSYVHINMCSYFQKGNNLQITYRLQEELSNTSSSWFTTLKCEMGNDVTDGVLFGTRSLVLITQPKYVFLCQGSYQYFCYW